MFAFRNLRIWVKLSLLIIISSIGFAAFSAFAFSTLGAVRVNGPLYQKLAQDQELVAEILPPPSNIIETHLIASQLLDEAEHGDSEAINALLKQADVLQKSYEERHIFWANALASSTTQELNQALLVDSYQPAKTYFQTFNDQYVPALRSGQIETVDSIFHDQLMPLYEEHRNAIDKVVELQNATISENETNAQTLVNRSSFLLIFLAVLTIGLTIGLGIFISRSITMPVSQLTHVANQISNGELEARASTGTTDEVGILASAFNSMAAQLRDMLASLEQRVAARTHNLVLAAEVGRTVSQVRDLNGMLKDACELILKEFNLYYVQVYLTNPSQTNLILEAGTGDVGTQLLERSHSLQLNTGSINGRAAIEKRSIVISDTTQSTIFRQNPLLPDTRGEMAVPLIVANKVVGVLDMQSSSAGVLNDEVIPAFEALAGQLAVAIQNANLLAETEQARAEVEKQARRLVRQGWNEHLDAIHKPERLGFVFDHNNVVPLTEVEEMQMSADGNTVSAPVAVTGEALGSLMVELDDESRVAQTSELVNIVARQVAQQIENLRLLESAERFRYEAEQASRRLTHEGWQEYLETNTTKSSGFVYDLNEVRPYNQDEVEQVEESALNLPLKVRDEAIGRLVVKDVEDKEAVGLASAVAERLSQHIEGLRLSMQTEQALASTRKQAQREQALRQITSAVRSSTDPATILRSAARELGNLLGRQTIVHMATATEVKTDRADHPAEVNGEAVTNDGNESVSSEDRS
jgi:GAF domain-containing protein/HAMP domain-containing protein